MSVNRGKQFEEVIKDAFMRQYDTFIMRLIDPQNGYAGVRNICDFVVYKQPTMFLIECKSCHGNTLPLTNITDTQWDGLVSNCSIHGMVCGVMLWFIDHDKTYFVTAQQLAKYKAEGRKSINIKDADELFEIKSKKKRVLCEYDMLEFLEHFGGK